MNVDRRFQMSAIKPYSEEFINRDRQFYSSQQILILKIKKKEIPTKDELQLLRIHQYRFINGDNYATVISQQ